MSGRFLRLCTGSESDKSRLQQTRSHEGMNEIMCQSTEIILLLSISYSSYVGQRARSTLPSSSFNQLQHTILA